MHSSSKAAPGSHQKGPRATCCSHYLVHIMTDPLSNQVYWACLKIFPVKAKSFTLTLRVIYWEAPRHHQQFVDLGLR